MLTLASHRRPLGPALVLLLVAAWLAALPAPAHARSGSPAPKPPMGWNSWNTFGCDVSEAKVRSAVDAIVSSGMKAAGYRYVVVDDCWFDPERDAAGNLRSNPSTFPHGMKALGDYIHSQGLKFGLYEVPTARTCAQWNSAYPGSTGSLGHEAQDAKQFAAWGVDYMKYDWCWWEGTLADQVRQFTLMRDAIDATGRPMVYSINPNSYHAPTGQSYNWGAIADMWRTTDDVLGSWDQDRETNTYPMGVLDSVDITAPLAAQNGPGHYNDPDMMVAGTGDLTTEEQRTHVALWALMGAPMMAGNDVTKMTTTLRSVLTNARLIKVDQDSLGAGGRRVRDDGTTEVFAKPLADGSVAVGLLNRGSTSAKISTTATEVGLTATSVTITDVWTGGVSTSSGALGATVPAHGIAVLQVAGGKPTASRTTALTGAGSGRCLGVVAGSTAEGADIEIGDCDHTARELVTTWENGEIRVFGDRCLDAYDQGTAAGTKVITWRCNGQANQRWVLAADGSIRGVQSGLCLDVSWAGTDAGSPVILWTCHGGSNQKWSRG